MLGVTTLEDALKARLFVTLATKVAAVGRKPANAGDRNPSLA